MTIAITPVTAANANFGPLGSAAWAAGMQMTGLGTNQLLYSTGATALAQSANLTYSDTLLNSGPGLQIGGTGTNAGWILGYGGSTSVSRIYTSFVTPSGGNYVLYGDVNNTILNGTASVFLRVAGSASQNQLSISSTAGAGPAITAGTATTDVQALSATQTWNNAAQAFTAVKVVITDTASAAGSLALSVLGGASGTTDLMHLDKGGNLTAGAMFASGFQAATSGYFQWANGTEIKTQGNGIITLFNNGDTDFGRLQFGGTTSSFPSIKRSTTNLQARLADDSAYATYDGKFAAEGTAGVASFGPSAVTSITVKDGIITAIS